MKLMFKIEHANGDVTFCKVAVSDIREIHGAYKELRDTYPTGLVSFVRPYFA